MKAIIIKAAHRPEWPDLEYPGWIVPETEDLLAIDLREPADLECLIPSDWFITHLPTGCSVRRGHYTAADSRERAVEVAQAFYREMKALGCDLTSIDQKAIETAVSTLSSEGKRDFWSKVAGWYEQRKMVEAKVDELQGISAADCESHKLEVGGSSPPPATTQDPIAVIERLGFGDNSTGPNE